MHGFAWAQYEATAPEIPQLTMEPELAIVVVETGKAPNARVGARSLRSSGLSNRDEKPSTACGLPAQSLKHEMSACIWYKKVLLRSLDGDGVFSPRMLLCPPQVQKEITKATALARTPQTSAKKKK